MRKFRFSPSLLNQFLLYQQEALNRSGEFFLVDEKQLLDNLNNIPQPTTEAMAKGIAFENCVRHGGFTDGGFEFDNDLLNEFRLILQGGIWQQWLETIIMVDGAEVTLGGYSDCIKHSTNHDVKTTSQYQFPHFLLSTQHRVYLLAANDSGIDLSNHIYLVTNFKDIYKEEYSFDRVKITNELTTICRDLITFIDAKMECITNRKIFNEEIRQQGNS